METKPPIAAALAAIGAALAAEFAGRYILARFAVHHWPILSGLRLIQIVLMLEILSTADLSLASLGLTRDAWPGGLTSGLRWSIGVGLIAAGGMAGLVLLGIDPLRLLSQPIPNKFPELCFFYLVGGLVSPVAEEIFFRGLIFGIFRRWGLTAAVLISTACFALAHWPLHAIPIFQIVGGLIFAFSYASSRSLLTPMLVHILANLSLFTLSLLAKQTELLRFIMQEKP